MTATTIDGWITTDEAQTLSGNNRAYVRWLANHGRVKAHKVGRDWLINQESLLTYIAEMKSLGFDTGTLACHFDCQRFDTSDCRNFECGNTICEPAAGEDCLSCEDDCNGIQSGNPGNRYCCGDGDGQNPVDCSDPRCTGNGNTCES